MGRPRKSDGTVDLPRDCWAKILEHYADVCDLERNGYNVRKLRVPATPVYGFGRFGIFFRRDERKDLLREVDMERKRRSDFTRACARTACRLRSVCTMLKEIMDGDVGEKMYAVMWTRVKNECGRARIVEREDPYGLWDLPNVKRPDLQKELRQADVSAPRAMTKLQKLELACMNGCQLCDKHPTTRKVMWHFGMRLCKECTHERTILEQDLTKADPSVLPKHYRGLPFDHVYVLPRDQRQASRHRRFWKADIRRRQLADKERLKRAREDEELKTKTKLRIIRKNARELKQQERDRVRAQRKLDIDSIIREYVREGVDLERSELYKKHTAMARPLTAEFKRTHMREILAELPRDCLTYHHAYP